MIYVIIQLLKMFCFLVVTGGAEMFKFGLLHIALNIGLLVLLIALLCMIIAALWKYLRK